MTISIAKNALKIVRAIHNILSIITKEQLMTISITVDAPPPQADIAFFVVMAREAGSVDTKLQYALTRTQGDRV